MPGSRWVKRLTRSLDSKGPRISDTREGNSRRPKKRPFRTISCSNGVSWGRTTARSPVLQSATPLAKTSIISGSCLPRTRTPGPSSTTSTRRPTGDGSIFIGVPSSDTSRSLARALSRSGMTRPGREEPRSPCIASSTSRSGPVGASWGPDARPEVRAAREPGRMVSL